ncbi:MAG: hypothetical protein LBU44_09835 [Mediterranea sp.]|jgi:hypothetical protein|nr:hypothetical protein [Mediterranea sp.]
MIQQSKIQILLLLWAIAGTANLAAQNRDKAWKDFRFVKNSEAGLTGYNAAGLKALPVGQLSVAEISATKDNGGFVNYYQSGNAISYGAQTESFYRLSPGVVFYGKIDYNHFAGKNMSGSAFIDPYGNPFDIVEYEEHPGEKKLETCNLTGAVSADVYNGLTLGGKVDYTAANYAKEKDLRHKNKLLDIAATAGLSYPITPAVEAGANYYYRRSVEGVEFGSYGTTDRQFYSLIAYGAFYGTAEPFGNVGYTKDNEEKPMVSDYHGASIQLNIRISPALVWHNEVTGKVRNGYYGKKAPYTIVYADHDGHLWEYNGTLSLRNGKNLHQLKVTADREDLKNYERIYRTEQQPNGSNKVVYYGSLKTTNRRVQHLNAEYTANLGIEDFNPAWTLKAALNHSGREQYASVYPYYRRQDIRATTLNLSAARNIVKNKAMYTLHAGATYGSGGGTPQADQTYVEPAAAQSAPASAERYLNQEYEYLTADRFAGEATLKYSRIFDANIKGHISVNYMFTAASDVAYIGSTHHRLRLAIGCTF